MPKSSTNLICPICNNLIRSKEQMYEYVKTIKDAKNFILKTSTMDRLGRLKPLLSSNEDT